MDPSKYSTNNPIVLVLQRLKPDLINTILSYKLSLIKAGTTLTLSINDKEKNVPNQCYVPLRLLLHHIGIYQRACQALLDLENSPESTRTTYMSITYYYCEVLLAFCKEVEDDVPRSDEKWRSAHLDYHFAMALNGDAFDQKMQNAKLKRIKRTWIDFKNKKAYAPVKTLSVMSYHKSCCKGQDMCGDTTANHEVSVAEMIDLVVAPYRKSAVVGTSVKLEKTVRFNRDVQEQTGTHNHTTTRNVKASVAPIASAMSSGTTSNIEEDDIDEAVNMFKIKEEDEKPSKIRKGGRKRKGTTTNAPDEPAGTKRPSRSVRAKEKSKAIIESEDEDIATNTAANSTPPIYDVDEGSQVMRTVQKVNLAATAEGRSASDPETTNKMARPSQAVMIRKKAGRVQETDDIDIDMGGTSATAEYAGQYDDVELPSTLEDWEDWNRIAFEQGNSRMFLKLGTWILLRFRQLANRPIDGDVDGTLIPDGPGFLDIDNDANFHEALGMDRLYSALVHIDTHPQFLAHIFHELGKASSEERLASSHPGFRPLPDLPTPIHSMISHDEFSWLQVVSHEDEDADDIDADGDIDDDEAPDDDDDGDVAGALNDMEISESTNVPDGSEQQKRKRAMSSTFSPPKTEGGRGHPKRPKSGTAGLFNRPSLPFVTSVVKAATTTTSMSSASHNTLDVVVDGVSPSTGHPYGIQDFQRQDKISESDEDGVISTDDPDQGISGSDRAYPARMPIHPSTDMLIRDSHMRSQSLTNRASQEDEDVRILVPSTPPE